MKLLWLAWTALALPLWSCAAHAFAPCEALAANPENLSREIGQAVLRRTPVKYHETVRSIKLVTQAPGDALIPFASVQQGTRVVVVPALFAEVACKIAVATYLWNENIQRDDFEQSAQAAAACVDSGKGYGTCLVGYARELAGRYRKAYDGLPVKSQHSAMTLYREAQQQVVMHEYAHHFLEHFARMRGERISRTDAEFEADLFAILNGIQAGEPVTAMYYFFKGLSDIEHNSRKPATPDYESASCRKSNVENITAFIGIEPLVVIDGAYGGDYTLTQNSPGKLRAAKARFARPAPALSNDACGRIAKVALNDSYAELRQLLERVAEDADWLFSKAKEVDTARANRLVGDLSAMAVKFQYLNGVTAKCLSLVLRKWGLIGRPLTPLMGQVDRLLDGAAGGNFLSEDFGRLLQAQGLAVLQERTDLNAPQRLDRAFALLQRAVDFNPAQSEAWVNLGFIAFKRALCADAAAFTERSLATFTGEKDSRAMVESFANKMREFARDPSVCAANGARFHPYPDI